jgi:hypothetical protein
MGRLRHLAVVLGLILSLLAPTMVCALPNAQMTAQEHACCKEMKGKCGSMRMPASHSCCRESIQAGHFNAVQPESISVPSAVAVAVLPSTMAFDFDLRSPGFEQISRNQNSPPISPPSVVSVLRI